MHHIFRSKEKKTQEIPLLEGLRNLDHQKKVIAGSLYLLHLRWFKMDSMLHLLKFMSDSEGDIHAFIQKTMLMNHRALYDFICQSVQTIDSVEAPQLVHHAQGNSNLSEKNATIREERGFHSQQKENVGEMKESIGERNENIDEGRNLKNQDIVQMENINFTPQEENFHEISQEEFENSKELSNIGESYDVPHRDSEIEMRSMEWKWMIVLYLINFAILETKSYDARIRTALFRIARILRIPSHELVKIEFKLGYQLSSTVKSNEKYKEEKKGFGKIVNIEELKRKTISSGRWWKLGGLSVIGGGLVAVASLLAAPILIPAMIGVLGLVAAGGTLIGLGAAAVSLTAAATGIITMGGLPLIAGIFGLTGGGLTAYMVDKRFSGVSHFQFTKNMSMTQAMILHDCHKAIKEEEEILKREFEKRTPQGSLTHQQKETHPHTQHVHIEGNQTPHSQGHPSIRRDEKEPLNTHLPPSTRINPLPSITFQSEKEAKEFVSKMKEDHNGMNVVISVAGCLNYHALSGKKGVREFSEKWLCASAVSPYAEHYVLEWEPKILSSLGHTIRDFVVSYVGKEIFKLWLAAVSATLTAALAAVSTPLIPLGLFALINNPWKLAMDRSIKCGKILSQVLCDRVQGNRPVTLIGVGLGARMIFEALKRMPETNEKIIENVFLIGGAISTDDVETWTRVRSLVSGRFVNAYCQKDWILGFLYRTLELSTTAAGIGPILHSHVENVCLDHLCSGYASYENPRVMQNILGYLRIEHGIPIFNDIHPERVQIRPEDIQMYDELSLDEREEIMKSVTSFLLNTERASEEEKVSLLASKASRIESYLKESQNQGNDTESKETQDHDSDVNNASDLNDVNGSDN